MKNPLPSTSSEFPIFANPEEIEQYFNEQLAACTGASHRDKNPAQGPSTVSVQIQTETQDTAELVPRDLPEPNLEEAAAAPMALERLDGVAFAPEAGPSGVQYAVAIGTTRTKSCQVPEPDEKKDLKIMYGGRDLLDLGANLVGEFWIMNSWQMGPEPKVKKPSKDPKSRHGKKDDKDDEYYPGIPPYYY